FTRGYVAELAPAGVPGERVAIAGSLLDGNGAPVPDGCIEIWQADASGRYAGGEDGGCRGVGRGAADREGALPLASVGPGRGGWRVRCDDDQDGARGRDGATPRGVDLRARTPASTLDAHVFPRRSGECRRPGARAGSS